MKYLKTFERNKNPQIGDYVICQEYDTNDDILKFINNNIGVLVEINNDHFNYLIEYENIPNNIISYFRHGNQRQMTLGEIIHCSDNKEDLELILNANKYNI